VSKEVGALMKTSPLSDLTMTAEVVDTTNGNIESASAPRQSAGHGWEGNTHHGFSQEYYFKMNLTILSVLVRRMNEEKRMQLTLRKEDLSLISVGFHLNF
jgi:hypothetical protein